MVKPDEDEHGSGPSQKQEAAGNSAIRNNTVNSKKTQSAAQLAAKRARGSQQQKQNSEYIETESGNRISRKSAIQGSRYIVLGGKSLIEHNAVLRGDLHRPDSNGPVIAIGRYTILGAKCSITPPLKSETRYPVKIGSYVHIGENTSIQAASIGSHVYIGNNCDIGKFAIIKEAVVIEDNTVIPPFTVISSFSKVSGSPAKLVEELPESADDVIELYTRRLYAGIDVGILPFLEAD
ncbi:dynactin subunit 5 [Sugiyamaella lignohabitans]|uniref:Dynactin subunit 5 n=1 Tax=Sugiyamaella lignohabitans TaxID=796027 RepID=A0A167E257_9ASCO|nr:dynactin subunit 5 [Sugiyamaella lignohabitans]ANB13556.1 dynactin subunit 5 [Sugiyamaella lignohabitans]